MLPLFITLQAFFTDTFERIERNEKGATAVEYGLLIGIVAIAVIGGFALLDEAVVELVSDIAAKLNITTTA